MAPPLDNYAAAQPAVQNDSIGDKLLREAQLLGGGIVYGAADAAREAVENPWTTTAKVAGSAAIGFGIGVLTRRSSFLLPVIGTAFTAGLIKDLVPRAGDVAQAMANTWQSADGFQQNQNVMKQALGYFAFDTALMTAGGIAGGAMSRMPTRAEMHEKRLLNQLFAHDEEMGFHSQRVSRLSGRIAEELRLPASQIRVAEHAGLGHDFGKIKIPAEILKGTRQTLTAGERAIVNTHPIHSKALLETVPYRGVLKEVPTVASQHHEHLNGTGYPYKTTGDQMGMPARVVQVADKVDAMLGPRSYQAGHTPDEIITVLRREVADNHIDPRVVDAFLRIPAVELYRIAQIGHQPIGKQYFLDMNGKTIADYAATAGSAPRLVTIAK